MTKHDASTKKDYTVTSVITETTVTDTIATSYDTGDSKIEGNEDKFIKLFNDNKEAKSDLKPKWLITTVEKGEKTARFTDLTNIILHPIYKVLFTIIISTQNRICSSKSISST